MTELDSLRAEIAACWVCAPFLAAGPRPVVQFSETAGILIIGQAPGTRVHASGVLSQDDSGDRLREWTGIPHEAFYDPGRVALVPMGFCFPGKGESGDLPPRPECAPLWHVRILDRLPADRLTLLVGTYAQSAYIPAAKRTLTQAVRAFRSYGTAVFPLPHPSWRSVGWARRNSWFESEVLPALREAVARRLYLVI